MDEGMMDGWLDGSPLGDKLGCADGSQPEAAPR